VADTLKLNILSPERRLVDGLAVGSVTLPGAEGQIQVLPGHAAMISTLETGVFTYELANGAQESGFISSGFVEIKGSDVTVLAETLELKGEIDVSRAQEAQRKAEAALQEADLDEHKFKKYQLKLQRAIIRQQFAAKE
jgi:F-type H+-transporting ATPase subunit epsilon